MNTALTFVTTKWLNCSYRFHVSNGFCLIYVQIVMDISDGVGQMPHSSSKKDPTFVMIFLFLSHGQVISCKTFNEVAMLLLQFTITLQRLSLTYQFQQIWKIILWTTNLYLYQKILFLLVFGSDNVPNETWIGF